MNAPLRTSGIKSGAPFPRLVGDVGGTNARFGWLAAQGAAMSHVATLRCADYPTLQLAIQKYLSDVGGPPARSCAIGIANPVVDDLVQMTNHHWSFSIAQVQALLGWEQFLVINDFTALALSLPSLAATDLRQVGGGASQAQGPMGLIGPGTGLGVSGLLWAEDGAPIPLNGEGGHVSLSPTSPLEDGVVASLRQRFGHASAERAVSGPGLVNLYAALCELAGESPLVLSAAEISDLAQRQSNPQCTAAVEMFFSFLGTVAGNLALSLGARGGVYIGGGIVPRLGDGIDRSSFRERFEGKGRFRSYLSGIPTFVVQAKTSPALMGAARALDES